MVMTRVIRREIVQVARMSQKLKVEVRSVGINGNNLL